MADLGHIDLGDSPLAMEAAGLAADYLATMHVVDSIDVKEVEIMQPDGNMVLDQTTLRNLELTQTLAGEKEGSLLGHRVDREGSRHEEERSEAIVNFAPLKYVS